MLVAAASADAIRRAWDRGDAVGPPECAGEPAEAEVAAVVATSGTTGEPRFVELTWDGLRATAAFYATRPDDRWELAVPVDRVAGLAVVARAWVAGVPVVAGGGTLVSLVPTQVRRRLAAGDDLSQYRTVLVGGGPVPEDIRALPNVVATYGMTETWGGVVHDGVALPGVAIRLADEILIRTPTIMRGYRDDPEATAAAFTERGWFRTGDVGRWAPDGRLEVVDRLKDIVITGGVNVSPSAVERVLLQHPGIADVCVAGVPDDEWGERVVAYVVLAPGAAAPELAALRDFARPHLSGPELPRDMVVIDAVPRTPSGKPLRRLLARAQSGSRRASSNEKAGTQIDTYSAPSGVE